MKLREHREDDTDAIASLLLELQNIHVIEYPERYRVMSVDEATETVRSRFAGNESFYIVAEERETTLGYIYVQVLNMRATTFTPERKYAYICEIAVDGSARRTGIGRALIEATRKHCKRENIDGLELQVGGFNNIALAFFESVGFTVINRRMSLTV